MQRIKDNPGTVSEQPAREVYLEPIITALATMLTGGGVEIR